MATIFMHPRQPRRRVTPYACELWSYLCDRAERGEELHCDEWHQLCRELNLNWGSMISPIETTKPMPDYFQWNPRAQQDWAEFKAARLELEAMSGRRAPRDN
jgi:hypothetical protein